jgi:hypothetical protein
VKVYAKKSRLLFRLEHSQLVTDMIKEIKGDVEPILLAYRKTIKSFDKKHGPFTAYCAERYMNRGIKGTLIECVSFMLNTNCLYFSGRKQLIAAVTWKSPFKKLWDLDDLYKLIRPAPPHLLDSSLIAIYISHIHLGLKPFEKLEVGCLEKLVKKLQIIGTCIKQENAKIKAQQKAKANTKPRGKK